MNDHEPSAPGWRRWFRYRLRTLLIAITLATIAFAWCRAQMLAAHRQRDLAAAVEAAGGVIYYDWENHTPGDRWWRININGRVTPKPMQQGSTPGPQWLREWIGDEYFQEIVEVDLDVATPWLISGTPTVGSDGNDSPNENDDAKTIVQDSLPDDSYDYDAETRREAAEFRRLIEDVLQKVGRVPSVRYFYLGGGGYVDDAMLAPLENLGELEELGLYNQDITGEGLIYLSQLKQLRWLDLSRTPFTDAGLYHLKRMKNIEYLDLHETKITDRRLSYLRELPRLRELDLSGLDLTQDEYAENYTIPTSPADVLGQMTQLRVLRLQDTRLDDFGFIANLTNLEELDLWGTGIQSEQIAALGKLPKLRVLNLYKTALDDKAVAGLAASQSLEKLYLHATEISDEACEHLGRISSLKELGVEDTEITKSGIELLTSTNPKLTLTQMGLEYVGR